MSSSIKFRCLDDSGDNIFLVDSLSGTGILATNSSINSSSGSLVVYGGLSIDNSTNSVSSTQGGALTIRGGASFERDVHIGGNLTVYGTQTQIISQTVNVYDNLIVVNSSPITNRDAGILFQRYQIENDSGLGTIVNDDIPILSGTISSSTSTTAILNANASLSDDAYTNYFIKITSGAGINQVRKITDYIGSSKTITVNTSWTIQPTLGATFSLYNKVYASQYYKADSNTFTLAYTTNDPDSSNNVSIPINDWVGLDSGSLRIFNTDQCLGLGSGGSLTALGGASISKDLYIGGDITVGNINATSITSSSVKISNLTTGSFLNLEDFYLGSTQSLLTTQSTGNNQKELLLFKEYTNTNPDRIRLRAGELAFDTFSNINGNRYTENISMYINSSGLVGINTTSPEVTLDVNGSIRSSGGIVSLEDNTLGSLYTQNGNIGINTVNPNYRLDVHGHAHVSGDLYIDGLISGGDSTSSTFSYLTLTSTDDSINYSTGSLVTWGGITIQTSTDAISVTAGGSFSTPGGAGIARRLFIGEGIVSSYTSNTIGSIFTTGGNVGIGTTSPSSNLHINVNSRGSLQFGPENSNGAYLSGSSGNLSIYTGNNNTGSLVIQCLQNGNVGIGNSNPLFKLDVNGTLNSTTVTGGELYVTKSTIANSVFTNISTNNLILSNCSTLGNLYITGGNIGINNTSPIHNFDAKGSMYLTSSHYINNNNITDVSGGCLNIAGAVVMGTSGIHFVPNGSGQPSVTTRSPGSKIILAPQLSGTNVDYSIGMENSNMWSSTPNANCGFKWYQGVENVMSISSSGSVICHSTTNASGIGTGGGLTVAGGAAITKDVWIGGSLFVGDQNISSIYGNVHINSFSGTGVCTVGNISIGKTMANTNYKITGNLKTTTDNTNVYTVSFKSLTTTTFDAVIYRIDSLGSGWTDSNLYLSWQITP